MTSQDVLSCLFVPFSSAERVARSAERVEKTAEIVFSGPFDGAIVPPRATSAALDAPRSPEDILIASRDVLRTALVVQFVSLGVPIVPLRAERNDWRAFRNERHAERNERRAFRNERHAERDEWHAERNESVVESVARDAAMLGLE